MQPKNVDLNKQYGNYRQFPVVTQQLVSYQFLLPPLPRSSVNRLQQSMLNNLSGKGNRKYSLVRKGGFWFVLTVSVGVFEATQKIIRNQRFQSIPRKFKKKIFAVRQNTLKLHCINFECFRPMFIDNLSISVC